MITWKMLLYLYVVSCLAMVLYIKKNQDTFEMSFQFLKDNKEELEDLGYGFYLGYLIIMSPLVWASILANKFKK